MNPTQTHTLSDDADTGQPLIDGQPATPEQVRELLHSGGYWWGGEYATYEVTEERKR